MDLFDELQETASAKIGATVNSLGGDLLDEAGIKQKDDSLLSDSLKIQATNKARAADIQKLNDSLNIGQKFLVGAGRGLTSIGRAVGLADPEDPIVTNAFNQMKAGPEVPIPIGPFTANLNPDKLAVQAGEIAGESAPFLPLGVGATAVRSTVPRILANATVGALEGGSIAKGHGGDAASVIQGSVLGGLTAGAADVVIPYVIRSGGTLLRKLGIKQKGPLLTPSGAPSAEFQAALDETGTSFDDLTRQAIGDANIPGISPTDAARKARFESQGIPATLGDITQDLTQQGTEQRIASVASGEAGEPIRQFKLGQSEIFKEKVSNLVDSLGVPDETGSAVKAALSGRKKLLTSQKNAFYKQALEADPQLKSVPIITDNIKEAIPSKSLFEDLSITAGDSVKQVKIALARFGLDESKEAVKLLKKSGMEPQPLTIENFDRFRKILGQIERESTTGAASVATGPIKRALDAELDVMDKSLEGVANDSVIQILKKARGIVKTSKTEFNPKSIVGRLIDTKRGSDIPIVETSKVANELLRPTAPIENLQRTLSVLSRSGGKGKKAIGNIKAKVVLDALEASMKAPSRKTAGIETIGGNQFAKHLNKIGEDKLRLLFSGDTKSLNKLLNLKQTALDITPSSDAMLKGSAPFNIDLANRLLKIPYLSDSVEILKAVARTGKNPRTAARAMKANPKIIEQANFFNREFPALSSALGIAAIVTTNEDK